MAQSRSLSADGAWSSGDTAQAQGRNAEPTAVILDSRTMQSSPESGARSGYEGAKRKKGSKLHVAVDTLGHLLALHVTPANVQDRAQAEELAKQVQEVTRAQRTAGVWRWGLHRRRGRRSCRRGRHQMGDSQAAECQEWLYLVATQVGMSVAGASAALPGLLAAAGWHAITSACLKPWQGCTSLPALCCWLLVSFTFFSFSIHTAADVHNTLRKCGGITSVQCTLCWAALLHGT